MTKISTEYAVYSIVQQSNDQDNLIERAYNIVQLQSNDQDIYIVR